MALRPSRRSPAGPALPPPTDAELDVLRVLWDRGPSTVREVHDVVGAARPIGYTTVLKQMQVMQQKGLLTRSERFRSHVYEAASTRETTQQQLASSVLHQVFAGSARGLLQSALAGRRVTAREIDDIRALLDEYDRPRR
ncbi:MAG: BlaI/MecI/CopY family transcriptional regulator [Acidobacteria bacterium]|jgi:BlaI family penicillinase repressor|nr:BlaI/MecI/CopY family transcriptional regulator [Acidobacteriota bacterium]